MIKRRNIMLVYGKTGSGKSTFIRNFVPRVADVHPLVFAVDPLGDYDTWGMAQATTVKEVIEALKGGARAVQFIPLKEEPPALFRFLWERLLPDPANPSRPRVPNVLLVVEEISNWTGPNYTEESLRKLILYGRHYGVHIIGVSQRPALTSRLLSSQANFTVALQTLEPRDVNYFMERFGEAFARAVQRLKPLQALIYSEADGRVITLEELISRWRANITTI